MNDKDYKIFPTLVRQVDNFINQQECKIIQQEILQHSLIDKHNLLTGDSVSSHLKSNILDILSIDLNERIKEVVKRYTEYSGLHNKNNIVTSWFNVQKKDTILLEHTHPNSVLSGAIYTNVDENSNALYFYNPNPFISFMENERDKDFSFEWFYIKPKLCSLLIFPSWLRHGSNRIKNQTENRTVISFNIR